MNSIVCWPWHAYSVENTLLKFLPHEEHTVKKDFLRVILFIQVEIFLGLKIFETIIVSVNIKTIKRFGTISSQMKKLTFVCFLGNLQIIMLQRKSVKRNIFLQISQITRIIQMNRPPAKRRVQSENIFTKGPDHK